MGSNRNTKVSVFGIGAFVLDRSGIGVLIQMSIGTDTGISATLIEICESLHLIKIRVCLFCLQSRELKMLLLNLYSNGQLEHSR